MGNIAMMPSEPVPTKLGLIDAYLIEARSIGGLSGSPAFVRETTRLGGIGAFHLMGLMHGHWDVPVEMVNDKAGDIEDQAASQAVNLGIAIVVPAKKIMEVLNRTELVEMRAKADEEHRKTLEPTFDEASATQLSEKTKTKSIDD
ncbi:MAG: hypothetical protein IH861_15935 [Chloroflexi bacterium]|nr:hypothetical protein [Chloroflexota bacterium]